MNQQELTALLATITGQLHTANNDEERALNGVQETLSGILLKQAPETVTNQSFTFQQSDLFFSQNIPGGRLQKIQDIISHTIEKNNDTDLRIFVRDVPVRTTQITGSVPDFAAGARVVNTIGPIRNIDGRNIFIDVFKVEKSIALYFQGQTQPAILFNARFNTGSILTVNNQRVDLTTKYTVIPTSVWINARLLSATAPVDYYCGLRVKGGTVTLLTAPTVVNNQLVLAPTNTITVDLDLEQNTQTGADESSPYGKDARAAEYHLPEKFSLRLTSSSKTILSIATARWKVYGQAASFTFANNQNVVYNAFLNRLAFPVTCDAPQFTVSDCQSPFLQMSGSAQVKNSWWAVSTAKLDVAHPLEADGNGALIVEGSTGLQAAWRTLENNAVALKHPFIIGEPGRIGITDLESNGAGVTQSLKLWQDEVNMFGTSVDLLYQKSVPAIFNVLAKGDEVVIIQTNADFKIDRPVAVNGEPVPVRSKNSVLVLGVSKLKNIIALYDDNILWDNKLPNDKIPMVDPIALAMHNALFTVTPPNGALLFGESDEAFEKVHSGNLFLTFGLFSYLPTLPDPYTANLGTLRQQFLRGPAGVAVTRGSTVWLWLIGRTHWQHSGEKDAVGVSFHFAPLAQAFQVGKIDHTQTTQPAPQTINTNTLSFFQTNTAQTTANGNALLAQVFPQTNAANNPALVNRVVIPNEVVQKVQTLSTLAADMFTLLDVSSKANQMGVSFSVNGLQLRGTTRFDVNLNAAGTNASIFPIQVQGLDVVTEGINARAFALPQISWEPVYNLTKPDVVGKDPPYGWNYYPNDGIATRVGNLSTKPVALSPIPLSKYLAQTYHSKEDNKTYALFNLPFGMLAFAILDQNSTQIKKANIDNLQPVFENYINGGIQLELTAGTSNSIGDDNLFEGFTLQLSNINDTAGNPTNTSTLGDSVTTIFHGDFLTPTDFTTQSRAAVPVKRLGISGYGASMYSDWHNSEAAFAQTSQALFNVSVGRTGHEVVQVKSVIYPWGIHVVRTITIFRLSNGYVGRVDSGWKAESDGKFDFRYNVQAFKQGTGSDPNTVKIFKQPNPYAIHPGVVRGLYNVRNIHEIDTTFKANTQVNALTYEYDPANHLIPIPHELMDELLKGLTFDADVLIENVVEGGTSKQTIDGVSCSMVASKGILGFVQLAPRGVPIREKTFSDLMQSQGGTIGGPINCTVKIAGTQQRMKLSRFDVNNSVDNASKPLFVAAARGSVVMPKDGSWSMVQHTRGSGDVAPIPESLSVPLVREGLWIADKVVNPADVASKLQRIAHPLELVRNAVDDTINFGFLQNLPTQKVLFLTPAFSTAQQFLLSKTPPLLADSYRLLNTKGIFPNIGKAEGADFGTAISLLKGVDLNNAAKEAFTDSGLTDAGKKAFQLLEIKAKEEGQKLLDQGYKLIKDKANDLANEAFKFDLPSFEYPLVDIDDMLKIYIEYKASTDNKNLPKKDYVGKFDFNVDSFAGDLAKTWKGRMHNLAMVVDLGPLKRLMTIQGNFNSQKGKATDLGSKDAGDDDGFTLPTPEIKFSDALEPVIQILEILAQLSQGNYADALKKGLKVAMSNNANIWEYKFEATKDIPLVRFPPGALYDAPQTPLKLEASLSLGVTFNAALKVTTDPKQLLPTAGAFFQFHGGLQVMCVSLAAATIYAVGQVDLKLAADTSPLISLTMKFGFGAQIGVGLPVIGNVSILFMVGVEIYADSSQKVIVTASLLFRGHAELLGGLVGVTITIEAKGSIEKGGPPPAPTNCKAQVTFALDISIFLVIDISFSESWEEQRQIA